MKPGLIIFFICSLLFISFPIKIVSAEIKAVKNSEGDTINYDIKEFSETYKNCNQSSDSCSYFIVKYPVITSGTAKYKINSFIISFLLDSIWSQEGIPDKDFNNMAVNFFRDYEKLKQEISNPMMTYQLNVNSEIKFQTESTVSLSISYFIFTGGAHPNSFTRLIVFDKSTGNSLPLSSFFKTGFEDDLNKKIDLAFRKLKGLSPADNLQDKGGLFENKITFNNNFAVSGSDIEFYYNPYEIAPYVEGSTELKIPISELKNILKK